jgi:Leucine-rich repeat (LRR) protein
LKKLPLEIFKLSNLIELDISNSQLEELPPQIENLKALEILSLRYNKIREIPRSISTLPCLIELTVDYDSLDIETRKEAGEELLSYYRRLIMNNLGE